MAKTYKILSMNERGKISVLFDEDGVQYKCSYYLPMKDDGSAYTDEDIDAFLEMHWPARDIEAIRQENEINKDPYAKARERVLAKTERDMTNRLTVNPEADRPDFGRS